MIHWCGRRFEWLAFDNSVVKWAQSRNRAANDVEKHLDGGPDVHRECDPGNVRSMYEISYLNCLYRS